MSPCFHHVSGSLRSANISFGSPYSVEDNSTPTGLIVKDGFLTDFTFVDTNREYYINYTAEGMGLRYEPGYSKGNCFYLSWGASSARALGWKFRAALANGGEGLFDIRETYAGSIPVCGHVDLWLEKE
ncbi:related to Mig1 protein [Ustilago bromivora]|uniref:Related to Mig1 - Mig1 protein, induced during biotrophic phase n=1 Tax=Ustilago bromivora TaxID=307758 RepID=A0A1K0G8U1_9BASI|nr:related to Mig1 protein [Ustilago bromivora]SYW78208.1 related to Mig1 - Mig1 protein, induced during biotrophic phase [Ustilago bromivora]